MNLWLKLAIDEAGSIPIVSDVSSNRIILKHGCPINPTYLLLVWTISGYDMETRIALTVTCCFCSPRAIQTRWTGAPVLAHFEHDEHTVERLLQ